AILARHEEIHADRMASDYAKGLKSAEAARASLEAFEAEARERLDTAEAARGNLQAAIDEAVTASFPAASRHNTAIEGEIPSGPAWSAWRSRTATRPPWRPC
ncbi:MAG TPA: hypothetical protein VFG47_09740, partial [Geminicoccaceae bacterium]|nr:hypothetical protein [Geminicoccaceae bacterium]